MILQQLRNGRDFKQLLKDLSPAHHGRIRHCLLNDVTAILLLAQLDETPAQSRQHLANDLFPPLLLFRGDGEEVLDDVVSHGMTGERGRVGGKNGGDGRDPRDVEDIEGESKRHAAVAVSREEEGVLAQRGAEGAPEGSE